MRITDEDITAWLDGELPAQESREIGERIAADPVLSRRVDGMRLDRDALGRAFDALGTTAPTYPAMPPAPRRGLFIGVALAASVALAFVTGFSLSGPPEIGDWKTEVAHYQILYVPDTLQALVPDPARLQQEFAKANERLGWELDAKTLGQIDGLTLRRVQILGFQGQPLIQVAYTEADGTPIAFCIMANDSGESSAPKAGSLLGLASESWQDAQGRYLVIGDNDLPKISRYGAQIRQQGGAT